MKRYPIILALIMLLLLVSITNAFQKTQVIARFSKPLKPSEVIELVQNFKLDLKEIYYDNGEIQGGYTLDEGEDIANAIQGMLDKHSLFLNETILKIQENMAHLSNEQEIYMISNLKQKFETARSDVEKNRFAFSAIKIIDGGTTQQLMKESIVNDITFVPSINHKSHKPENSSSKDEVNIESLYHETWAPYAGTSEVSQYKAYNTFYFNGNMFSWTSTYEHETQVYDKNFADYDKYWSSNLPAKYYDTPFIDSIDNFTIGSSQASLIQPFTEYYTYMALRPVPGGSSNATVRIKGQKGVRRPSFCYWTYCIFSEATTNSIVTFTAPSSISWQY